MTFTAASEQDTERLGRALADAAEPGLTIALTGDLGAGKTRLVRAVVAALGDDRHFVSSPTFVLIHEYEGRLPVYHIDAYRLRDVDEFEALGIDELLESDGVCLIEWADRVAPALPADRLEIHITATGPQSRLVRLTPRGKRSSETARRVRAALLKRDGNT